MSRKGHKIIAIGRDNSRLESLASSSANIETIAVDIATTEGRQKIKDHVKANKVDALINNAGLMAPSGSLLQVEAEDWRHQTAVNVEAPLFLSQLLHENLHHGRILNLTIYSSYKVTSGLACYGISKAALNMLTEYMCEELSASDIAVGLVLPGIVNTDIQSQLPPNSTANNIARLEPEEVAKFLAWLILDTTNEIFGKDVYDIYDDWHQEYWNQGPKIIHPLS